MRRASPRNCSLFASETLPVSALSYRCTTGTNVMRSGATSRTLSVAGVPELGKLLSALVRLDDRVRRIDVGEDLEARAE